MNSEKLKLIKDVINNNSSIKTNLDYIKQEIEANDYEIVGEVEILNDDNILYNNIDSFCGGDLTEKNIIDYFNQLIAGCGVIIIGYKLIKKFLHDSFSNSKELYIVEADNKDSTYGIIKVKNKGGRSIFIFNVRDKDTGDYYTIDILSEISNAGPNNILDTKIKFIVTYYRGAAGYSYSTESEWIKIKDFTLDWFKNQELDNKLK